jgi:hypothetical protein
MKSSLFVKKKITWRERSTNQTQILQNPVLVNLRVKVSESSPQCNRVAQTPPGELLCLLDGRVRLHRDRARPTVLKRRGRWQRPHDRKASGDTDFSWGSEKGERSCAGTHSGSGATSSSPAPHPRRTPELTLLSFVAQNFNLCDQLF